MRYSQEFKDNVVARLLSKELSISEAVEQYSIGKSPISYWPKIAREQAGRSSTAAITCTTVTASTMLRKLSNGCRAL